MQTIIYGGCWLVILVSFFYQTRIVKVKSDCVKIVLCNVLSDNNNVSFWSRVINNIRSFQMQLMLYAHILDLT